LGFTGGNNLGLKSASGEYIVLLNNDTLVDRDWLRYLIEAIESEKNIGIVQSLVLTDGIPYKYYKTNGTVNLLGHNIMEVFEINKDGIGEIFQATGCSLIINKNIVDKFGELFPDEYFAYAEDTFLCFRVKYLGKKILHTSRSIVHHKGNATFKKHNASKLFFYQERNRLLNFFIFFDNIFFVKYIPYLIFNFCLKFSASLFIKKYSLAGLFKAYFWILFNYKWINAERRKLREKFIMKDEYVLGYITSKLFNGENVPERAINFLSLLYCKLFRIRILENKKVK